MKLSQCPENSFATIQSLPEELLEEAYQHGLYQGEKIKIIRNQIGVPLLIEIRGAQYGLRKKDANNILVSKENQ